MKKMLLTILSLGILCSCQTQEEIKKEQELKELETIKEHVKNENIPENVKEWLIDSKTQKILTILCTKESKKCEKIKSNVDELNKEVKTYYVEIDKITEEEKDIYKKTYELKDYTGYLPYIMLIEKDKLLVTKTDIYKLEDIKKIIKKNSNYEMHPLE